MNTTTWSAVGGWKAHIRWLNIWRSNEAASEFTNNLFLTESILDFLDQLWLGWNGHKQSANKQNGLWTNSSTTNTYQLGLANATTMQQLYFTYTQAVWNNLAYPGASKLLTTTLRLLQIRATIWLANITVSKNIGAAIFRSATVMFYCFVQN